ncbi:MAG: VOC family protein [Actinobacteria bacterium]|nr:VOC family protein [Actinomycetota bacterium]
MINSLQHVGVGVTDVDRSYEFYRRHLRFKIKLSELEDDVEELVPMFGRRPRMRILNALNAYGGATLELFRHIDTPPRIKPTPASWGDSGYLELGVEVKGLGKIYGGMEKAGVDMLTGIHELKTAAGSTWRYAYIKDPDGLPIQLIDLSVARADQGPGLVCGIVHVGLGVLDLERARAFYGVLGFDEELYHGRDVAGELEPVMSSPGELEVVYLGRKAGSTARLVSFTGGMVKLLHSNGRGSERVFKGRRFGDPGLAEIGLDVDDAAAALKKAMGAGAAEVVPPTDFNWGFGPRGTLVYISDPEGNVVEFVKLKSVFKLPPGALNWVVARPGRMLARLRIL